MSRKKCTSGIKFSEIYDSMAKTGEIESQKEFTSLIGIAPQTLTKYKATRKKSRGWQEPDMPGDWIIRWAIKTNSSIDDLLKSYLKVERNKGEGENAGGVAKEQSLQEELILALYAEEDLRQTGGVKKFVMEVPKTYIEGSFKENKHNLIAWVMDADNMDPFIRRNEALIIDNRFKEIKGDGIYAFRNQEGKIKICRVCERLEGGIDIVNDNRAYESHRGPMLGSNISKLEVLGRVVGFYRAI